jgi:hypothetical protein
MHIGSQTDGQAESCETDNQTNTNFNNREEINAQLIVNKNNFF